MTCKTSCAVGLNLKKIAGTASLRVVLCLDFPKVGADHEGPSAQFIALVSAPASLILAGVLTIVIIAVRVVG